MKSFIAVIALLAGLFVLVMSFYGLVLAFKASIVLCVLAFFIEPAPFVFGLTMFLFHFDIAQRIVEAIKR